MASAAGAIADDLRAAAQRPIIKSAIYWILRCLYGKVEDCCRSVETGDSA